MRARRGGGRARRELREPRVRRVRRRAGRDGRVRRVLGLTVPRFEAAFTPCVEVGWRLAPAFWGCGYATEAARASLAFGFGALGLAEMVSFTVPANVRSRRVMERIGMTRDPREDFDHPLLPEGHPLRRHVLYRIRAGAGHTARADS